MADTKIPVKKLVDSSGYYFPLGTLESVVSAEGITVKNTIGSYKPNDVIEPKTTLKTILFRILTKTGEADAVLHLSNIDVDTLSEFSTRVPSSPLVAELLQKLKQDIEDKLIKAAHYKGSVDYYKDLPTSTAIYGDIYNVRYKGSSGTDPDGSNYIFDENDQNWDKLSGFVDLGDYYTVSEIDNKLSSLKIYIDDHDNDIKDSYVKKIDATASVTAKAGECITGITQVDGKITSVTSSKLGTNVTVSPVVHGFDSNKIADIKVDNTTTSLYSPYNLGIVEFTHSDYWYHLYNTGWVEQGGIATCKTSSKSLLIPFVVKMASNEYFVQVTQHDKTGNDTIVPFKKIHTQNGIIVSWENFSTPSFDWICRGISSGSYVITYTVVFNPNGGRISETTRKVIKNSEVGTLPVPVYSGYSFEGWFTSKTSGTQIDSFTVISKDVTFYAHWKEESTSVLLCTEDHSSLIITENKLYNIDVGESTEPLLASEVEHKPVVTENKLYGISLRDSTDPLLSTEVNKDNVNTEDYSNKLKV